MAFRGWSLPRTRWPLADFLTYLVGAGRVGLACLFVGFTQQEAGFCRRRPLRAHNDGSGFTITTSCAAALATLPGLGQFAKRYRR